MFGLANRRYVGAKTKLLAKIDSAIKQFYKNKNNLSFFDIFGGTGVVSEFFAHKKEFGKIIINDFLSSNYAIYRGFFAQEFDFKKLENIKLDLDSTKENYYSKQFGGRFFSQNDARKIGLIRDFIDKAHKNKKINDDEFYILLSSLIYSADKIANTVGHYDAWRKNVDLCDKFKFNLIAPIQTKAKIEIFCQDSNALAKRFAINKRNINFAFIDPPYNSRQYSRFYHLLETLCENKKENLIGCARKPKPKNLSQYCNNNAMLAFSDLINQMAAFCEILIITYNNTYSANPRSNARLNENEIIDILSRVGKVEKIELNHKAFNSGKSDIKNHKERIFICSI